MEVTFKQVGINKGEKKMPHIIASITNYPKASKIVLTRGQGSTSFEQAVEWCDFAAYEGFAGDTDEIVARHGNKLSQSESTLYFGHMFNLEQKHFRR